MSPKVTKAGLAFFLLLSVVEAGVIADVHLTLKAQRFLLQSLTDFTISNNAAELIKLINIDCSRPYTGSDPDFLKSLIEIQRDSTEKYLQDASLSPKTRKELQNSLNHSCGCCKKT
jgi:hypothetical protein